jgi:hypothetical protein
MSQELAAECLRMSVLADRIDEERNQKSKCRIPNEIQVSGW